MTIFDVLRHEHYLIRARLERIQEAGLSRPATRQRQFRQLQALLVAHAAAVDAIFLQPLEASAATADLARQARVRQDLVASLMEVIAALPPADPQWVAYLQVLAEVLELQVKVMEKALFRAARKVLDRETLEALGEAMLELGKGHEVPAGAEPPPPPVLLEGPGSLH